ncbi:MAG: YceI family protein [Kofleriaceae bacterium]
MTTQIWNIDSSHSGIHFSVRHLVISKVRGTFARWSGTITLDGEDLARAKVDVVIDASSLDTGVADRDTHLRSADFFDVEKFPEITFKSTRVEPAGGDRWRVTGELALHGVTREVVLDVEHSGRAKDPWGNTRLGFSAKTALERKEFGLVWNQTLDAGGLMIGERVDVDIDLEAVHQVAAA